MFSRRELSLPCCFLLRPLLATTLQRDRFVSAQETHSAAVNHMSYCEVLTRCRLDVIVASSPEFAVHVVQVLHRTRLLNAKPILGDAAQENAGEFELFKLQIFTAYNGTESDESC